VQAVEAVAKIDQIDRLSVPARFEERTAKRTAGESFATMQCFCPLAAHPRSSKRSQSREKHNSRQLPNPRSNKGSGETNAVFSEAIAKL
jgi:hypothetical protein